MAYIKIFPIHNESHLSEAIDYAIKKEKTNNNLYADSYNCGINTAFDCFKLTKLNAKEINYSEQSNRKNILAWHIIQSFSPEDNISPEQALAIGKEFMKDKFPNFQYVIGTHTDKDHIHNHIIFNSVNAVTQKKLHTNKKNYYEMRDVSDGLCRKNGLSVIEKNSKSKTEKLKNDIDESIKKANSLSDFTAIMQELGYTLKFPKNNMYISFKSADMQKFIRSTSISMSYTLSAIEKRIKSNEKSTPKNHRYVYDNKTKYTTVRKKIKTEIDSSIKKCSCFKDFIDDMKRKGIEIKENKHIAFKEKNGENFIRGKSIGFDYEADVIKFRLKFKQEYEKICREKIQKLYDINSVSDGKLSNWMAGENSKILNNAKLFLKENYGINETGLPFFYKIYKQYNEEKIKIEEKTEEIKKLNEEISKYIKTENAVKNYWRLKITAQNYKKILQTKSEELNPLETEKYKAEIKKFNEAVEIMKYAKDKMGQKGISLKYLDSVKQDLLTKKDNLKNEEIKLKLKFQNWETIKYNFEYVLKADLSAAAYEYESELKIKQQQQQKKEQRKEKIKNFFIRGL